VHSKLIFFILLTLAWPLSHGGEATSVAEDDALEKRVMRVSRIALPGLPEPRRSPIRMPIWRLT